MSKKKKRAKKYEKKLIIDASFADIIELSVKDVKPRVYKGKIPVSNKKAIKHDND